MVEDKGFAYFGHVVSVGDCRTFYLIKYMFVIGAPDTDYIIEFQIFYMTLTLKTLVVCWKRSMSKKKRQH